jgi:hypothetical protein
MNEHDDKRLLGDVLGEREIGIAGGKSGPGQGKKTVGAAKRDDVVAVERKAARRPAS